MSRSIGEFEQLLILAVLRLGDDAYGVTIRRAVQESTGRDIAAGAVYTALGRLEARGFVAASDGEPSPEPTGMKRRYYRVEPEGAERLYRSYRDLQTMAKGLIPKLARLAGEGAKGEA
jgi:PadR family transcriptional regulator PadR